jgi:hypothetical protein
MIILLTPIFRIKRFFSNFLVNFRREIIETSIALLSFITQNAPPMRRMKTMMSALPTNPSKRAENICQVWGWLSTEWKESGRITVLVVPSGKIFCALLYSPPSTSHEETAAITIKEKIMTNVCGNFSFEAI